MSLGSEPVMVTYQLFAASLLVAVIIANAQDAPNSREVEDSPGSSIHHSCQVDADCSGLQHCTGNVCHCGPTLKRHFEDPQRCVPPILTYEFNKELDLEKLGRSLHAPRNKILKLVLQDIIDNIEGTGGKIINVNEPSFERRDASTKFSVVITLLNPEAADENVNEHHRHKRFDISGAFGNTGGTVTTIALPDADFGGNCETNDTCVLGPHLQCVSDVCTCQSGYIVVNAVCYESRTLGQSCTHTAQCGAWTICSTTCQCDSTSYDNSGTCLPYRSFGQTCDNTDQCHYTNAYCSGTCGCMNGYRESTTEAGVCEMIPVVTLPPDRGLGGACSVNTQCVLQSNLICDGGFCVCISGYEEGEGFLAGKCIQPVIINGEWTYTRYTPPLSAAQTTYLLNGNNFLIPIHLTYEAFDLQINATVHEVLSSEIVVEDEKVKGVVSYSYINLGPLSGSRRRRSTADDAFAQAAKEAGFDVDEVSTHIEQPLESPCENNEDCIGHLTGGIFCDYRGLCDCVDGWTKSRNTCIQI